MRQPEADSSATIPTAPATAPTIAQLTGQTRNPAPGAVPLLEAFAACASGEIDDTTIRWLARWA
ncbi:hypothetical protein WS81_10530 [Burkholderia sp. MSMB2040]|nr:hypothetical protein WS81_10530 [Burkholderia sp. MSMB2040]